MALILFLLLLSLHIPATASNFYSTEAFRYIPRTVQHVTTVPVHKTENHMRAILLSQHTKWQGTRYRLGGSTREGIDCSALMQHVFSDTMNLRLPRTTYEQMLRGNRVEKHNLKAGDLLFFRMNTRGRHVGVYIGNSEFLHASTSKGVTVSTMENRYWHSRFMTARRITG